MQQGTERLHARVVLCCTHLSCGSDQSVWLKNGEELSASKLTSSIRFDDATGDIPAAEGNSSDCVSREPSFHPARNRIPDLSPREHPSQRAAKDFSFPGEMCLETLRPLLIGTSSESLVSPGFPIQVASLTCFAPAGLDIYRHDAGVPTQPPISSIPREEPLLAGFTSEEVIPEVGMFRVSFVLHDLHVRQIEWV